MLTLQRKEWLAPEIQYPKINPMLRFILLLFLLPGLSFAGEPAPAARQEITHLIAHLKDSGCQFNRNGSWYSANEAVAHLNKKYDYLLAKGLVATAEDFIARAASESSISGKPYQVRCGTNAPVESGQWLRSALARYRSNGR